MAEFISTGVVNAGHDIYFKYPDGLCFVHCECGWSAQVTSYPNSWSIIEVKVLRKNHLAEFGIVIEPPRPTTQPSD